MYVCRPCIERFDLQWDPHMSTSNPGCELGRLHRDGPGTVQRFWVDALRRTYPNSSQRWRRATVEAQLMAMGKLYPKEGGRSPPRMC